MGSIVDVTYKSLLFHRCKIDRKTNLIPLGMKLMKRVPPFDVVSMGIAIDGEVKRTVVVGCGERTRSFCAVRSLPSRQANLVDCSSCCS